MKMEAVDDLKNRILGSLWASVAGDALGVPVEFRSRDELAADPVVSMRGHGTHMQPPGTWSDDASLILCTIESLLVSDGVDTQDMAERFHRWLVEAHWTPHGTVFDIGIATRQALARFAEGKKPELCGGRQEYDNGNGSLMRILPVSLWVRHGSEEEALHLVHRASRITHAHPRTQMVCGFFTLMTWALLDGQSPEKALEHAWNESEGYYKFHEDFSREWPQMHRLSPEVLPGLAPSAIRSTGYSVHTLEAAVWCLLKGGTLEESILRAVNLGDDTDTVGCVTGALAGLHHGFENVPAGWITALARREELLKVFENFAFRLGSDS